MPNRRTRLERSATLAALALALAGCGGDTTSQLPVKSALLGRTIEQVVVEPKGNTRGRPLLLLLHGRSSTPDDLDSHELHDALTRLGKNAPIVVLVNGSDHSYYHDRREGRWGSYVVRDVIPAVVRRYHADGRRVAIGGFSMGGFGALDIARLHPGRFCAVGGHSAALWDSGGETPVGAYDDAEDFARHDVIGAARSNSHLYGRTKVWLDVGTEDPFLHADTELAHLLHGATFHVWPGVHGPSYWWPHLDDYLRFYSNALRSC
jgi:S-formylglutathione hydrolase FrmB